MTIVIIVAMQADGHRDPRPVDGQVEHVPAELVGAEEVAPRSAAGAAARSRSTPSRAARRTGREQGEHREHREDHQPEQPVVAAEDPAAKSRARRPAPVDRPAPAACRPQASPELMPAPAGRGSRRRCRPRSSRRRPRPRSAGRSPGAPGSRALERLDGERPEARPAEHDLRGDRAGDHVPEVDRDQRDHRQQRVGECVASGGSCRRRGPSPERS